MKPCGFGGVSREAWGCWGSPPRLCPPYQEGLVGALADGSIVRAVHGGLAGEAGVELAHVLLRLLRGTWWLLPQGPQNIPSLPPPPPHTRQGLKGGSSLRASRSSQLMWRKKGCFCGIWGCQAGFGGCPLAPPAHPCTCTSAASPGPPPTLWLGFRLRNWKRNRDRDGNGGEDLHK